MVAKCLLCPRTSPPFELDANGLCPSCAAREARKTAANKATIERYKRDGDAFVKILTSDKCDVCDICKGFSSKRFVIDHAPRLPAHIGCRCCYAPWTYSDKKRWAQEHPGDTE